MNTKKDCCVVCRKVWFDPLRRGEVSERYCANFDCECHTDSTKKCMACIFQESRGFVPKGEPHTCNPAPQHTSLENEAAKDRLYYQQEGYTDGYFAGKQDGKNEERNHIRALIEAKKEVMNPKVNAVLRGYIDVRNRLLDSLAEEIEK